jgi:magnesium-transporting ATPase (P-type)
MGDRTVMPVIAIVLIVVVVVFGAFEINRWRRPDLADVLTTTQKTRRIIGLVILLLLGVMAYFGTYWPAPIFSPLVFRQMELIYWLFFALLTVFIPFIAFLEFKDSLHRAAEIRRQTYREILATPLDKLPTDSNPKKTDLK